MESEKTEICEIIKNPGYIQEKRNTIIIVIEKKKYCSKEQEKL